MNVLALFFLLQASFAQQNTSTIPQIIDTCYGFLQSHLCEGTKWNLSYHFYRPSLEKYSADQWLWDSGSHMIVWSWRNVTNSILDLRTMLQFQQKSGFIPEMIFWENRTEAQNLEIRLTYSNDQWTDITQMPVLAFSLRAIWNQTGNITLLQEFVPALVKYFQWWDNERAIDGDHLVYILHNFESGMDASPIYDPTFNVTDDQPGFYQLHPLFEELLLAYNWIYKWNRTEILARGNAPTKENLDKWFFVKDVGVNAVLAAGWGVLAELASYFDSSLSATCKTYQQQLEQSIVANLWDNNNKRFVSVWKDWFGKNQVVATETVQSVMVLLLDSLPQNLVDSIIDTQLTNANKFWTTFPVPTVSADDPHFTPKEVVDLMWRGPAWGFTNWFVMEGLYKHGRVDLAGELLDRWIAMVEMSGIWEMYNPLTAEAYGVEGLGMSTLIVDWIYRLGYAIPN